MGANNDNLKEVLKPIKKMFVNKVFMGSSTGNMLVNNKNIISNI